MKNNRVKKLVLLGFLFCFVGCSLDKRNNSEVEVLLNSIVNESRFVSSDEVAKRIIDGDPSLVLVDVRSMYDFEEYSLPGAINIPSEELLLAANKTHFENDFQDIVLFSNDDIYADQAWYFLQKQGYKNTYVMCGGLNTWFSTIMLPEEPKQGSPEQAFELYSFRKGASIYFGGSKPQIPAVEESTKVPTQPVKKKEVKVQKKVKKQAEGGC